MDYSRMGGGVYGPDPEQMALISRLKDQNAAPTPPVRMPAPAPPDAAPAPPISNAYTPATNTGSNLPAPASPSAQGRGPSQAPPGWDNAKWNDPNKHDPKYDIGHLIADDHTSADLQADMPAIQKLYPGAVFDGKDVVTIPGYGGIDMLRAASTGNGSPQWMPVGGGGGGMPPIQAPQMPGIGIVPGMQNPGMNDDFWQKIMTALQAAGQAEQDPNRARTMMGQPTSTALTAQLRG